MYNLTLSSIMRQSDKYVQRYISQVSTLFDMLDNNCCAVWLEGDSTDSTFEALSKAKEDLESKGNTIILIKHNNGGPLYRSINNLNRWRQISECWNTCLSNLQEAKVTICVESDLIWDPIVVPGLISLLDSEHPVICPMLMIKYIRSRPDIPERFYDIWAFARQNQGFFNDYPFWINDTPDRLLELTSCGGMIISTYDIQKKTRFNRDTCVMKFDTSIKLFMDKKTKIYHEK